MQQSPVCENRIRMQKKKGGYGENGDEEMGTKQRYGTVAVPFWVPLAFSQCLVENSLQVCRFLSVVEEARP